jgi:hypothetical protein
MRELCADPSLLISVELHIRGSRCADTGERGDPRACALLFPWLRERGLAPAARWRADFLLVHPANVEAVAWPRSQDQRPLRSPGDPRWRRAPLWPRCLRGLALTKASGLLRLADGRRAGLVRGASTAVAARAWARSRAVRDLGVRARAPAPLPTPIAIRSYTCAASRGRRALPRDGPTGYGVSAFQEPDPVLVVDPGGRSLPPALGARLRAGAAQRRGAL